MGGRATSACRVEAILKEGRSEDGGKGYRSKGWGHGPSVARALAAALVEEEGVYGRGARSSHVVLGRDVIAAVRAAKTGRMIVEEEDTGKREGKAGRTALIYRSVNARWAPMPGRQAVEGTQSRLVEAILEDSEENDGGTGDAKLVQEVLDVVKVEMGKRGDAPVDAALSNIRCSLTERFGHLWHVFASKHPPLVVLPAPNASVVVRCLVGKWSIVVFKHHEANDVAGSLDWIAIRATAARGFRLLALGMGALGLLYFHVKCEGNLMEEAPSNGETETCSHLRNLLPWILSVCAVMFVVPRLQSAARQRALRRVKEA